MGVGHLQVSYATLYGLRINLSFDSITFFSDLLQMISENTSFVFVVLKVIAEGIVATWVVAHFVEWKSRLVVFDW